MANHNREGYPSQQQALAAVKTLLSWIEGKNSEREGLKETPERVLRSYDELFAGYKQDAREILSKTFGHIESFNDMVILDNIDFKSCCEHHLLPVTGKAKIAYVPQKRVVGISKLARIVDVFSRRLQLQERMTSEIAIAIDKDLQPQGVAVCIEASHSCMTMRGVCKDNSMMKTYHFTGIFINNQKLIDRFCSY